MSINKSEKNINLCFQNATDYLDLKICIYLWSCLNRCTEVSWTSWCPYSGHSTCKAMQQECNDSSTHGMSLFVTSRYIKWHSIVSQERGYMSLETSMSQNLLKHQSQIHLYLTHVSYHKRSSGVMLHLSVSILVMKCLSAYF